MKNFNGVYGAFAWLSFVTMSTFAYLWATLDSSAYGLVALLFGAIFALCVSAFLSSDVQPKQGTVIEIDFRHNSILRRAA